MNVSAFPHFHMDFQLTHPQTTTFPRDEQLSAAKYAATDKNVSELISHNCNIFMTSYCCCMLCTSIQRDHLKLCLCLVQNFMTVT